MAERLLVLFDIDATLVTTSRAGIKSMEDAGRELYFETFSIEGVNFAGRLDPLIIDDLLVANGLEPTERRREEMRAGYGRNLGRRLRVAGVANALGGAAELVDRLAGDHRFSLGLLTGNFPETGRMKLGACGISSDRFPIQVWGCDSPHEVPARDHLPAVAFERYEACFGEPIGGMRRAWSGIRLTMWRAPRRMGAGASGWRRAALMFLTLSQRGRIWWSRTYSRQTRLWRGLWADGYLWARSSATVRFGNEDGYDRELRRAVR